jgi:hypothetical protein
MKNRIAAVPQYVTLYVPLARTDGQPDNSAIATVAALAEHGFTVHQAEVREVHHGRGVERTVKIDGLTPDGRVTKWVPALEAAMRALRVGEVEIDEDSYFDDLLRKMDAPRNTERRRSARVSDGAAPVSA